MRACGVGPSFEESFLGGEMAKLTLEQGGERKIFRWAGESPSLLGTFRNCSLTGLSHRVVCGELGDTTLN